MLTGKNAETIVRKEFFPQCITLLRHAPEVPVLANVELQQIVTRKQMLRNPTQSEACQACQPGLGRPILDFHQVRADNLPSARQLV